MQNEHFLSALDDEVINRVIVNRRDALTKAAKAGIGAAVLTSMPVAFGLSARQAFGQALPQQIRDVLNFALTLEYLEDEFYKMGLAASGLIPGNARPSFEIISAHETAHVALLKSVLGSAAGAKPQFDFTAGGAFAPFSDYAQFLILSQAFEDTGVRAYKGGATALKANGDVLQTALQIHSVEARHAAEVRRMRTGEATSGWITGSGVGAPAPIAAVYGAGSPAAMFPAEGNVTQGGVNLTSALSGYSNESITEAFDEPLDVQTVLGIADPFVQ